MKVFGLTISRTKAQLPTPGTLSGVSGSGGWWPLIREACTGNWQRNITTSTESVLAYFAVYACVTLIAGDIAKMRLRLVEQDADGIWTEVTKPSAFWPVLRKPNGYQTRIAFITWWIVSKLIHGNTYALKVRDQRGIVTGLYILDPTRVRPMVSPDGSVFYALQQDNLSQLTEAVMCPLFHPLVGVSPLFASGLAALQGLRIMNQSERFFANGSQPGGILTAPGTISDETAGRLKERWDSSYTGENVGKVAVLGDGLKYDAMMFNARDSQLIDQLKMTGEQVCATFHVPPDMIGIGPPPTYNNIEARNQQYYSQALQIHVESLELLLDEGLGLDQVPGKVLGTEFDLDGLLRMDTATLIDAAGKAIGGNGMTPDEARKKFFGLGKIPGGDTVYMQEQNWPLRMLSERELPTRPPTPPAPLPPDAPPAPDDDTPDEDAVKYILAAFTKELAA